MKASKLLILSALVTSAVGCATDGPNIYGGLAGQDVVGNKNYVTVSNVWNEMDALHLAEEHCAGYGRSAKFDSMNGYRAVFDFVE